MFRKYYTTQMSDSAKQLQTRFLKMRSQTGRKAKLFSAIMAMVMIMTTICVTVVMAAVGADGLEHWDKNEAYFLAGVQGNAEFDIENSPDWLKNISSNGKVNVFIKRVSIRETTGLVTHLRLVTLSGDEGNIELKQNSTCGYYSENGERILLVFDTSEPTEINPLGEINTNKIYVRLLENGVNTLASYSGMDFVYFIDGIKLDGFVQLSDTYEIGNFIDVENYYENSIQVNYYTYFERDYQNRIVEGINLHITSANEKYISIIPEIDIPEAKNIEIFICAPDYIGKIGTTKPYSLSEYNHKEIKIENIFPEKIYETGKDYVVNYVVSDEWGNVIYRQQNTVTVK